MQDRKVTLIRPAARGDVAALVRLRLANAERHVRPAPDRFRILDEEAVRRYFEDVVGRALISVAEVDGERRPPCRRPADRRRITCRFGGDPSGRTSHDAPRGASRREVSLSPGTVAP
jgi:hypothetical protein